jgi:transposase-like protein
MTHDELTSVERQAPARERMQDRIRVGMKAMLEEIMEEEMTEHLSAGYREQTPGQRGRCNGSYTRGLITEVGRIDQLKMPPDREGTFLTEVFERYMPNDRSAKMTGSFEEAVLETYLQGISTWKIKRVTGKLFGTQISKDAVSRIAGRLDEEFVAWRYPYLHLDATFLKAIWAGAAEDVAVELPQARWQRCVVHFKRNVLAKVPQKETKGVAADLKAVFQAARRETAEGLAQGFTDRYRALYPKAVQCLEAGLADALTYTEFLCRNFCISHHRSIRTTQRVGATLPRGEAPNQGRGRLRQPAER